MRIWGFWKRKKEQEHLNIEETTVKEEAAPGGEGVLGTAPESSDDAGQEDGVFRFDRGRHRPTIRSSICTGEQVAGFKDLQTGKFIEIMLVRNNEDMEEFTRKYGISREEISREW